MTPQPPPGQGPIDPRDAFSPPNPPNTSGGFTPGGATGAGPGTTNFIPNPAGMPTGAPMGAGMAPPPGSMPPPGMMPPGMMPPGMMPPGMMPQMMFPYPPPRPAKSFTRTIFLTLASLIFTGSLVANIYLVLMLMAVGGGASGMQNVVAEGDSSNKIAVIRVDGLINGNAADQFDRLMKRVEADASVKALVIEVDSPGGSVTASDQIYHRIDQYRKTNGKKVVISQGALAASGGYYISCAGDYIMAQPTTMTGNIGVLWPLFNINKLAEKIGLEDRTIQSSGADYKTAGAWLKPENPRDREYMQALIDASFEGFKDVVRDGRPAVKKMTKDEADKKVFNGKIFLAAEAKKLGLIDATGFPDDAYAKAVSLAGLSGKPYVVRYQERPSFMDLLGARSNVSSPQGVNINGVNVNVDAKGLQDLMTPRMMYLWTGQ